MASDQESDDKQCETLPGTWIKRHREAIFFSLVAGMSVMSGFGTTLMLAKRKDSAYFDKGIVSSGLPESGGSLALRALGRGSMYAFGGFSLFCLAVWKLTGVHSMQELRGKIQSAVRTITPPETTPRPRGRSEFASIRELVNYLLDEDARSKSVTDGKNS
jgi:hypothetical protein